MSLSVLQLTTRDMMRARAMLKEQAGLPDTDPYDIIDPTGDPDLRRNLVIWCVLSRKDQSFTWEQAWDTPLEAMFPEDEEPATAGETAEDGEAEAPPTPGPEQPTSEPGRQESGSNGKRPAAEPALNSSTTSP